ncbi:hypothetical protein ACFQ1I_38785 [Kitasatospora arboriphila]
MPAPIAPDDSTDAPVATADPDLPATLATAVAPRRRSPTHRPRPYPACGSRPCC